VTGDKWLTCIDIDEMLDYLRATASSRKLTQFSCACCRRLWHLLIDSRSRRAVEAAEKSVEGIIARGEMEAAWHESVEALDRVWRNHREVSVELLSHGGAAEAGMSVAEAVVRTDEETFDILYHVSHVALATRDAIAYSAAKAVAQVIDPPNHVVEQTDIFDHRDNTEGPTDNQEYYRLMASDRILVKKQDAGIIRSAWVGEMQEQCWLLREVFGNPFHPVTVDDAWLMWNGRTLVKLAQAIFEERAFERMPILADGLEEACCTDADILDHCRQPEQHVPGCWVLDLLLGKK
jgi:hypothetical protein